MSREIDHAVAEHVMGIYFKKDPDDETPGILKSMCEHYSTDIAAAWLVAEKLVQEKIYFEIHPPLDIGEQWSVTGYDGYNAERNSNADGEADTAPMAICLAALKAKGIEVPK